MARLWVALAMVVALAGTALAKRDPACTCTREQLLPGPATLDVPTNAKLWHLPRVSPAAPDQEIASYELAPQTAYELTDPKLSFTTDAGPDDSPPTDPVVTYVSITLAGSAKVERSPISILHVVAATSGDTAVVRIAFIDALGEQVYWTTPAGLSACDPGFSLLPGTVRVAISAYDLAGNESGTDVIEAQAALDPGYQPSCAHHERSDDGVFGLLVLSPLLAFCLIVMLVIIARVRTRARLANPPEPMAVPAAEALARAVRLRALGVLAALVAAGGYAMPNNDLLVVVLFVSPVAIVVAYIALSRLIDASQALGLLRYDGVTAEVQRDQVEIIVGKRRVVVRASRWLVERARRHGVPKATL